MGDATSPGWRPIWSRAGSKRSPGSRCQGLGIVLKDPPSSWSLGSPVGSHRPHVPNEIRKVPVTEQLTDGLRFAVVKPVVADHAKQHRSVGIGRRGCSRRRHRQQIVAGERVEDRIRGARHLVPGCPHLGQGRGAGGIAEPTDGVQSGHGQGHTLPPEERVLFPVGKVANHPTDAVHWFETAPSVVIVDAVQRAHPFEPREPQLINQWMRHRARFPSPTCGPAQPAPTWYSRCHTRQPGCHEDRLDQPGHRNDQGG